MQKKIIIAFAGGHGGHPVIHGYAPHTSTASKTGAQIGATQEHVLVPDAHQPAEIVHAATKGYPDAPVFFFLAVDILIIVCVFLLVRKKSPKGKS